MSDQQPFTADPPTAAPRRLHRSRTDRQIAGVAGGLAEYFGVEASWVRIAFVASILLPGPQVLLYAILWAVIPSD
ncbi:PspC domain-containing protein [Gordonia sp. HY002]|uniref:PspC domain-containing protein n=1 Tax=Gordonia zhenghanii TaxID=2911516 RepID=UPI001EF158CF|nr:PspC domain-containing protein [Gordonia zhenghanii]MCF8571382.1 PspC domain-containing protein [Gordonia zhenghanii]MCF8604894.1 PspC domain-containing protein [Gordonia zhenghanii]